MSDGTAGARRPDDPAVEAARVRAVDRAVRSHPGPWRCDDPMARDAGMRIVPLGVDAGAVSVADGAFDCAGEVELQCGDTHLETLPARYRGRIADLLAVVTSAEIGQAGTGRGDGGGADPG